VQFHGVRPAAQVTEHGHLGVGRAGILPAEETVSIRRGARLLHRLTTGRVRPTGGQDACAPTRHAQLFHEVITNSGVVAFSVTPH